MVATVNSPIDTYRDAFLKFLSEGMSYTDALEQFELTKFQEAALTEMLTREARIDIISHEFVTNDERRAPALFQLLTRAQFEQRSAIDFEEQATPLMLAGWTSEVPEGYKHNSGKFWRQCPVASLYWRAPSKRPGKPGRRYLSTNQAFNAMQKGQ